MDFYKLFKKYPFLMMLCISSLILTLIGFAGKKSIYADYKSSPTNTPQLAVVLEGAGEGKYPWQMFEQTKKKTGVMQGSDYVCKSDSAQPDRTIKQIDKESGKGETTQPDRLKSNHTVNEKKYSDAEQENKKSNRTENITENSKENIKGSFNENTKENIKTEDRSNYGSMENHKSKDNAEQNDKQSKAAYVTDSNTDKIDSSANKTTEGKSAFDHKDMKALAEKEFNFKKVSGNYFKDALFIGDSRTVGLSEYSDLKKSTFYANVGLTIYDVFDKKIAEINGSKTTILDALHIKKFKKIYIMLGINELGTGSAVTFTKQYEKVIRTIRKLQPDAIIYIESIMNIAKEKSDADPVYNNVNIKKRNDHLLKLADDTKVFYLDINEAVTDKNGYLPSKYTFDYIHLKAAYYKLWTDYLLTHGVVD